MISKQWREIKNIQSIQQIAGKRGKEYQEKRVGNGKQQQNKTIEISLHIYLTPIKVNELNFPI